MRKFFLIFLPTIFFLTLISSSPVNACTYSSDISDTTVDPNFNQEVTVNSDSDCFATGITYIILAYPAKIGSERYSNYSVDRRQPLDARTLKGRVNLFDSARGKSNPGEWILKVCNANSTAECGEGSSKVLARFSFRVAALPTPTPPQNLPRVVLPNQCLYWVGDTVNLTIENTIPGTNYKWWWDGEWWVTRDPVKATGASFTLSLPPETHPRVEKKTFCIDIDGSRRGCPGGPNSLPLEFTNTNPPPPRSCVPSPAPTGQLFKPTACNCDPNINLVECSDQGGNFIEGQGCCKGIETAGGICIPTDTSGFTGFFLRWAVGLAGIVALFLILLAGFQMMTSVGNPEKLQAAKELLTSAIIGLLFVIFSVVLLQIITGKPLLELPGFSKIGTKCISDGGCTDGNPCTVDTCNAGICNYAKAPQGTVCEKDRETYQPTKWCDGNGNCVSCNNDTDCVDGDPCTVDTCAAGSCSHPRAPEDTICERDPNSYQPIKWCNKDGQCALKP